MKLYYAHCVQLYGTHQEILDLELLSRLGFSIENPNTPEHGEKYAQWGMGYFMKNVIPHCDGCAFRALPDGSIPSGVFMEVEYFLKAGKPVIELPGIALRRILNYDQTVRYLKEAGVR